MSSKAGSSRRVCARSKVWAVASSQTEIIAKIATVAMGQTWQPILVLAIAGTDVPARPETAKGRRPRRKKARAKRAR